MATTYTRSTTQTSTLTKVVYVTRKVQADFLAILDTYGYFSENYTQQLVHDVRVFLDEEVIDRIKFIWTNSNSSYVIEEFQYEVVMAGIGLADDRSGGIRFNPLLANANFHVRIFYNERWKQMSDTQKDTIRRDLSLNWGPAGRLDYSGGRWISDRTYSKGDYGLVRSRFIR